MATPNSWASTSSTVQVSNFWKQRTDGSSKEIIYCRKCERSSLQNRTTSPGNQGRQRGCVRNQPCGTWFLIYCFFELRRCATVHPWIFLVHVKRGGNSDLLCILVTEEDRRSEPQHRKQDFADDHGDMQHRRLLLDNGEHLVHHDFESTKFAIVVEHLLVLHPTLSRIHHSICNLRHETSVPGVEESLYATNWESAGSAQKVNHLLYQVL